MKKVMTWLVSEGDKDKFNEEMDKSIENIESEGDEVIDIKFDTAFINGDDAEIFLYSALILSTK